MNIGIIGVAKWLRRAVTLAGTLAAGAAFFAAIPLTLDQSGLHSAAALAGKGNGHDNGRGGGRSNGNGHGHGQGHNKAGDDGILLDSGNDGTGTKLPGSLNAANASPSAFEHANRRSRPGALDAYMDAMSDYAAALESGDTAAQEAALDDAAAALADAANKDIAIDAGVVDAVNQALDGKQDGFEHTGEPGDPIHDAEQAIADRINPPPL